MCHKLCVTKLYVLRAIPFTDASTDIEVSHALARTSIKLSLSNQPLLDMRFLLFQLCKLHVTEEKCRCLIQD